MLLLTQPVPGALARTDRRGPWSTGSLILFALLATVSPRIARATTYTVCPTGCNYTDLQQAVTDHLGAGNTIDVLSGTYRLAGPLAITGKSGTAQQPAVLQSSPGVVIDCADNYQNTALWTLYSGNVYSASRDSSTMDTAVVAVYVNDARYTYVSSDFASLAAGQWRYNRSQQQVYINVGGGNPGAQATFIENRNRPSAISVASTSYLVIDGLTALRAYDKGIKVTGAAGAKLQSVTVKNCTVAECTKQGIYYLQTTGSSITNNVSHDNLHDGIYLLTSDHCVISGNQAYKNDDLNPLVRSGRVGIKVGDTSDTLDVTDVTVDYNVVHDNEDTGICLHGGSRIAVRRNVSYSNGDHGYDNNPTGQVAYINDIAFRNAHDGISIESTSPDVAIYNCMLVHNALTTATLGDSTGNVRELFVGATAGFVSNNNVIVGLTPGSIPGQLGHRHLVEYPGSVTYDTLQQYVRATNQDLQSHRSMPSFIDTVAADFRLKTGADSSVDAAKTDVTGWQSPMWLSIDPKGFVPHDSQAMEPNTGTGTINYADIGPFEFDASEVPTAPTISVATSQNELVVTWTSTQYNGDLSSFYQAFVGGGGVGSGSPAPPGGANCVHASGLNACAIYPVYVTITDVNTSLNSSSTSVNAQTKCSGPTGIQCSGSRPLAGGNGLTGGEAGDAATEDQPLSLTLRAVRGGHQEIAYAIPRSLAGSPIDLGVFDVAGRRVLTIARGPGEAGRFSAPLLQGQVGSKRAGVFFVRLRAGGQTLGRMIVVR